MTYESVILADSPTAYLPLTESGVAIGSVYADATGHGYDVSVVTGTLTHISGPVAGQTAPDFPGAPGYDGLLGSVTAGLPVDGQPYSLEGWVKPERLAYWMQWIAYGPPGNTGPFIGSDMNAGSASTHLEFWNPNNGSNVVLGSNLADGSWHYLVLTDNAAGTQQYYLDGVLATTASVGTSNGVVYASTNVLALGDPQQAGTRYAPSNEAYTGGLAHLAIYPTVLSAAQVRTHYFARSGTPPPALALSPTSGPVGTTVSAALSAFTPSAPATVTFAGSTVATGTTDASGALDTPFSVPNNAASPVVVEASTGSPLYTADAPFTLIFAPPFPLSAYDHAVLASGPLAYWRLTEAGGTATDQTGHGFDAAYPADNTVTPRGATLAGCLPCAFFKDTSGAGGSGSAPGIRIGSPAGLPLNPRQMTLEAWLLPQFPTDVAVTRSAYMSPLSWGHDYTASSTLPMWIWELQAWASTQPCAVTYPDLIHGEFSSVGELAANTTSLTQCPTAGWPYGTWHHLVMALDQDTPANNGVYLDGQPFLSSGTKFTPFSAMTGTIGYGAIGSVSGETWTGGMANLALYTICLSQAQVQAHLAASVCPGVRTPRNQVYWKR